MRYTYIDKTYTHREGEGEGERFRERRRLSLHLLVVFFSFYFSFYSFLTCLLVLRNHLLFSCMMTLTFLSVESNLGIYKRRQQAYKLYQPHKDFGSQQNNFGNGKFGKILIIIRVGYNRGSPTLCCHALTLVLLDLDRKDR